ncbi:MAG: class I SAM-dependent methyltransferase [Fermentimonas sp.]|nr:class I SAM-dependent methyltransferase [Fermentimonas sp.]
MKDSLLFIRFATQYAKENRTFRHIKQFKRWHRDKKSGDSTLSRGLPWMTYDAINFLEQICNRSMRVFEWGSGGSTLFFASRCKEVTSVEHDTFWIKSLRKKIEELNLDNVTIKEIESMPINNFDTLNPENPDDFISKEKKSSGLSFEYYVKSIDQFEKEYFDVVVVDGRSRNSCIKRAIPHIKKGGYLIVDNSDRKYYLSPFPYLNNPEKWEKREFMGPVFFQHAFGKTTIFKKLIS